MSGARTDELGIGVIGLGEMGRTHLSAWAAARAAGVPCRVVAVADRSPERLEGRATAGGRPAFDQSEVRAFLDPQALLAEDDVDVISICTHTDTHVELALAAIAAGVHVLVEKPVSLVSTEVERLLSASKGARVLCMPAFCMRFWPGWDWLHERIRAGTFGAVRSASFERLGSAPVWAPEFYTDTARSGGALFDLHIHDVDFVRWCFGDPAEVLVSGDLDHVTALYRFAAGPAHVAAEGGWNHAAGYPFRMHYSVAFEEATVDFELGRDPTVRIHRAGRSAPAELPLPAASAYEAEVRHFAEAVVAGGGELRVTLDDALAVTRLLELERSRLAPAPLRG